MSGMDDRAKQFKAAAEAQLTGPALKREINTLRRFLFRNQGCRFTKAAQQALYMAVIAHYGNSAAHHASGYAAACDTPATTAFTAGAGSSGPTSASCADPSRGAGVPHPAGDEDSDEGDRGNAADATDAPILRLLDDALKMPFTVFTSPQKDKLLSLYWTVLGTDGSAGANAGNGTKPTPAATLTLSLVDIVDAGKNKAQLSLFTDGGEEYPQEVLVSDASTLKHLRTALDNGNVISVTVQENETGASLVSFSVDNE
ncbi:hypothetical protein conserved [Leishmania donovani]|uniref:Uncharacterized protein n=3 Tax=Leishmania donovani species complex TaxID=38574 RepID=A4I947_LEIIN|nr:hypothetical protein, unknown function [Leishmania infantum JPCM5]XP_003864020.1 hypothetical protein, unknown function [Leishmania donovani]CAC9532717.1 hypothetical_protein_-_conserved [Leishmania infantum]AYU82174.1 hypothetical protein LdCL_330026300 [Leishmania donovani]TPP53682.1 hypothetical protein CGC21_37665 [Leishmania donovani]TPP55503.1 hypothetical protein CGC20_10485 [Leishmania donovani]CAJ1992178.1 hypothetical protein conserved [Leishmania donovani]|eukprot:XP_001468266.1 hypothetical protein, unknown function [Leishmania infantum JPCM5]